MLMVPCFTKEGEKKNNMDEVNVKCGARRIRTNDEDRRKITRSRSSSFNFGKSRPVGVCVFPAYYCSRNNRGTVEKRDGKQKAGKWSAEQKLSRRKNVSGVRMRERRMERKKSAWNGVRRGKKEKDEKKKRRIKEEERGKRKQWYHPRKIKERMNGIKRAKETWNARDKNAARNGEDRKITRKSSRIEDGGETSQGGNVARVLRPSFYSLWGIKKQRETKRRVTWSLEQDKENKRKEGERERERRRKQRVEKKKQKGGRKRSSVLCGRAPTSSKHERANNRPGARVYPPLFGPCEEACGHVSPRIPGDRIKRGRRKGSREGVCEVEREGSGDSRKGGGEEAPVKSLGPLGATHRYV